MLSIVFITTIIKTNCSPERCCNVMCSQYVFINTLSITVYHYILSLILSVLVVIADLSYYMVVFKLLMSSRHWT